MRAVVIGNGESRAWFKPNQVKANDVITWGCNAIYRDGYVDALVSIITLCNRRYMTQGIV